MNPNAFQCWACHQYQHTVEFQKQLPPSSHHLQPTKWWTILVPIVNNIIIIMFTGLVYIFHTRKGKCLHTSSKNVSEKSWACFILVNLNIGTQSHWKSSSSLKSRILGSFVTSLAVTVDGVMLTRTACSFKFAAECIPANCWIKLRPRICIGQSIIHSGSHCKLLNKNECKLFSWACA